MHRYNWDSNFDTGIEEIDIQHRRFVSLINLVDQRDSVDPVLAEFLRHMVYHFRCEQALMDAYEEDYAAMEEAEHAAEDILSRRAIDAFRDGHISKGELCDQLYAFVLSHARDRNQEVMGAIIARRNAV